MFVQSDRIRDFVFPIAEIERTPEGNLRLVRCRGTGFLVGDGGYALTCAHVVDGAPDEPNRGLAAILCPTRGGWWSVQIRRREVHPTEDVAAFVLDDSSLGSFIAVVTGMAAASMTYMAWGYPDDVTLELEADGKLVERPDLVYTEGYIRRSISNELPIPNIPGSKFFELSELGGRGFSGAPVIKRETGGGIWQAVGIYCGERVTEPATRVGYCIRSEAFGSWAPQIFGATISSLRSQKSWP